MPVGASLESFVEVDLPLRANLRMECAQMAIRLLIEAEEPEVEALLTYLDSRYDAEPSQKIYLLERTLRWL